MYVQKISEITSQNMAEYLRLPDPTVDDLNTLNTLMDVAIDYIAKYTGRTAKELDEFNDIVIVGLILVQDMWDNRTMYVDNSNMNKTVESILNLHVVNLL